MKCLRVKDWSERFESAKSRTYKLKGQTYMPNKQGLGYERIMAMQDGPAVYGAWCAMINMLSRMEAPRQGYLTDTGRASGCTLTADDMAHLTRCPAPLMARMIEICASQAVGWLEDATAKDTARIPDGPSPLPSPSPSPSQERESTRAEVPQDTAGQVRYIQTARVDWSLSAVDVENELKAMPTGSARAEVVRQFCADAFNGDRPRNPIGMLRGYIGKANAPAAAPRTFGRPTEKPPMGRWVDPHADVIPGLTDYRGGKA